MLPYIIEPITGVIVVLLTFKFIITMLKLIFSHREKIEQIRNGYHTTETNKSVLEKNFIDHRQNNN